jgi:hypothetical protein
MCAVAETALLGSGDLISSGGIPAGSTSSASSQGKRDEDLTSIRFPVLLAIGPLMVTADRRA